MNKDKIISELLGIEFNERKVVEIFGKGLLIRVIRNAQESLYIIYKETKIDEPIYNLYTKNGFITMISFWKII